MKFYIKEKSITTNKNANKSLILCISDLHYTKNLGNNFLMTLIQKICEIDPTCICFLGDLCDDNSYEDVINWLNTLAKVAPVYFIYGNHDIEKFKIGNKTYRVKTNLPGNVKSDIQNINNLTVLKGNSSASINGVNFIGANYFHNTHVDDAISYMNRHTPNFKQDEFNIMLCHNPKIMEVKTFDRLNEDYQKNINCIVSGHTHNGLVPPFLDFTNSNTGFYIKDQGLLPSLVKGYFESYNHSAFSDYTGIICPPLTTLPDRNAVFRKANEIIYQPGIQLIRVKKEN